MNENISSPKDVNPDYSSPISSRSRVGLVWISLIVFVVILIALLIFIIQNSKTVQIHYLGAKGSISFGVAMLVSAVAGIVLTLLIGSVRIVQLKLKRTTANPQKRET